GPNAGSPRSWRPISPATAGSWASMRLARLAFSGSTAPDPRLRPARDRMRDTERQGPAAHMAPKVLGKRFRNYLAMFLADMAGRLESSYADLKNTAGIRKELSESLDREMATNEILRVISSSPTDVQPVFDTIAQSAARLCKAQFCHVFRFDGEFMHFAASHGLTSEGVEAIRTRGPSTPGRAGAAARSILSGTVEEIPDVHADPDYEHGHA